MTDSMDPHSTPPHERPPYQAPSSGPPSQPPPYQPPYQPPSYQAPYEPPGQPPYQPPSSPPPYQPPYEPPGSSQQPSYVPPPAFAPQPGPEPAAQYPGAGPGWQQYPYAEQWPPPPQQRSHARRNALIAAGTVVVLVGAGLGAYFAFRGSGGSSHRLSLPSSFAGYSREQDATSSRVERTLRGMGNGAGGEEQRIFNASTIALYQKDSDVTTKLVVFALPTSSMPHDQGNSPAARTKGLLTFMGSAASERPAGTHGGSSRCGATSIGAQSETACAWSDASTTGMLVSVGNAVPPDELGRVELTLRDQVD